MFLKNRNCTECRKNYLSLEKCVEKIDIKEGKHYLLRDCITVQFLLYTVNECDTALQFFTMETTTTKKELVLNIFELSDF